MQLTHELDLIQSLQQLIANYLAKNPQLTLNALSQRANVPVTSLRRLHQGQQKNEFAPHSVLNLVSYIFREKNLQNLMIKVDRCVREFLNKHFGQFIFSSHQGCACGEKMHALQRLQNEYAARISEVLDV